MERLPSAELPPFKVLLIEVFANALYYNTAMTLSFVESKNWTSSLFGLWFQLLGEHFTRLHDVKLSILALSSLLHVPFGAWPASLKGELKNIVCAVMDLIFKFRKMEVEKEKRAQEERSGDGNDSDGDLLPLESDPGEGYLNKLEAENDGPSSILFAKSTTYEDHQDAASDLMDGDISSRLLQAYQDDDDDDNIFDLEDEDDFEVLTDQIDDVLFFLEAFQGFSQRDTPVYEALVKVFTDEDKAKLSQLSQEGNQRIAKKAQQ